jgi:beta-lactamase regulating signal transducer with metallopeptidase domain
MLLLYLAGLVLRSLALGAFVGIVLVRVRNTELRHAVWTLVLLLMLLMPIADAVMPTALAPTPIREVIVPIQTFVFVAPPIKVQTVELSPSKSALSTVDWWQIPAALTVLVTLAFLMRFGFMLRQVQRIRKESRRVETSLWNDWRQERGSAVLVESDLVTVPLTIGLWKPIVALPVGWRSWEDSKLRDVLVHEWTHVRRRDWAIASVAAFAKCVFWFNPLVWWIERKLSSLAEHASDEASVRFSGDPQRYAETLLQFAAVAREGHRWSGGVAMAQHKISLRIERVLALQRPGRGVLSSGAWAALFMAAFPVLYVSAVLQAAPGEVAPLSPLKVLQTVQSSVAPPVPGVVATQAVAPVPPPTRAPLPQVNPPATPAAPSQNPVNPAAPAPPLTINPPDLVGEIRLILAPVEGPARQGQVQLQINRWVSGAVWNIQNPGLNPLTWATNNNAFTFTLTGLQDRTLQFAGADGGLFSYGCRDCAFVVWDSGVGLLSASQAPGIVFQVSADGKALTATCRAVECRVAGRSAGVATPELNLASALLVSRIRSSENWTFPILRDGATRVCFNVKADGTPFTEADCPVTPNGGLVTGIIFSVVRQ